MALQRPPQHRAGIKHIYIAAEDSAWDNDLIEADLERMKEAGEDVDGHPVEIYRMGDSRYDLGAEFPVCGEQKSVRSYLKSGETPTEFELIPLRLRDWNHARDICDTGAAQAWMFCAENGLQSCDGLGLSTRGEGKSKRVTSKGLDTLAEFGINLPAEVGMAVFMLSKGPSDAEKKRLGS